MTKKSKTTVEQTASERRAEIARGVGMNAEAGRPGNRAHTTPIINRNIEGSLHG